VKHPRIESHKGFASGVLKTIWRYELLV